MDHVIVCSALPRDICDGLISRGFELIMMPPYERLQKGISAHPDMLLFLFGNVCLTTREYYLIAKENLKKIEILGYTIMLTDEIPSRDYPHDILFNSLLLNNSIYGNEKGMSTKLKALTRERGIDIVNVRQGYTKCSTLKISENAVITADKGIFEATKKNGNAALLISNGHIRLDGYDTGFIGGCGGYFEDKVYFCGNLSLHPDAEKIIEFCNKNEKECISLGNNELFDAGSLFFI